METAHDIAGYMFGKFDTELSLLTVYTVHYHKYKSLLTVYHSLLTVYHSSLPHVQ